MGVLYGDLGQEQHPESLLGQAEGQIDIFEAFGRIALVKRLIQKDLATKSRGA